MWHDFHGRFPSNLELNMMDGGVGCDRSMGMGLQDHFRIPRVLRADSFWYHRHQPLAFIYMISHVSSLSREYQYMTCNYRRNTHGVTRMLNACRFNCDLSTHLFVMSTSGWCYCVKSTEEDVYVYSGASICKQIQNSWWQISCMSSSPFTFISFTEVLEQ